MLQTPQQDQLIRQGTISSPTHWRTIREEFHRVLNTTSAPPRQLMLSTSLPDLHLIRLLGHHTMPRISLSRNTLSADSCGDCFATSSMAREQHTLVSPRAQLHAPPRWLNFSQGSCNTTDDASDHRTIPQSFPAGSVDPAKKRFERRPTGDRFP